MKILTNTKSRINGLQVTEVNIKSLPNTGLTMDAVYALAAFQAQPEVDPTGPGTHHVLLGTHGRCTAYTNNWSEKTMIILKELLSSMEEDLLPRHFEVSAVDLEDSHEGFGSSTVEEGTRQI